MHRRALLGRLSAVIGVAALGVNLSGCSAGPAGTQGDPTAASDTRGDAAKQAHGPVLTPQQSGTTNRLQAISPVNDHVVWASGVGGTFVLTTDGGKTWRSRVVPGAETLQFRDVQGFTDRVAYLLAAGVGTDSRIYKTQDGGDTWQLQFENQDPNGFYDCFAFWNPRRGITMADSINGRFPVIRTSDGQHWEDIGDKLPPALDGEAAFAASGTCIATQGGRRAWITTGAAAKARVLATTDRGETWAAYDTPIIQGTGSSGGLSIAFRDPHHGILGGGELAAPTDFSDNFARSGDGGKTWTLGARTPFTGAIFGLSYALGRSGDEDGEGDDDEGEEGDEHHSPRITVVATGPGGAAWSADEGNSWTLLPGVANFWAVAFADSRTGWLVGTEGRILKINL